MFLILWEYEVKTDRVPCFEKAYGPEGSWAELFRRSPHYLSTQLLRDPFRSFIHFTLDFWDSEIAYQQFKLTYHAGYDWLDRETCHFFLAERYVGSFTGISSDTDTNTKPTF